MEEGEAARFDSEWWRQNKAKTLKRNRGNNLTRALQGFERQLEDVRLTVEEIGGGAQPTKLGPTDQGPGAWFRFRAGGRTVDVPAEPLASLSPALDEVEAARQDTYRDCNPLFNDATRAVLDRFQGLITRAKQEIEGLLPIDARLQLLVWSLYEFPKFGDRSREEALPPEPHVGLPEHGRIHLAWRGVPLPPGEPVLEGRVGLIPYLDGLLASGLHGGTKEELGRVRVLGSKLTDLRWRYTEAQRQEVPPAYRGALREHEERASQAMLRLRAALMIPLQGQSQVQLHLLFVPALLGVRQAVGEFAAIVTGARLSLVDLLAHRCRNGLP